MQSVSSRLDEHYPSKELSFVSGWNGVEPSGRWTTDFAELIFQPKQKSVLEYEFTIIFAPYTHPPSLDNQDVVFLLTAGEKLDLDA